MASKVFAAIDVGSNELSMKVYEITPKKRGEGDRLRQQHS